MKKLLVIITLVLVSAFIFAGLKDVPENHWAYDSVMMLQKAGIVTGYPDGTFRGVNNVTRYELAVFLARVMDLLEKDIQKVMVTVDVHENDIAALYEITGSLKKALANAVTKEEVEVLSKRLDVIDKDVIRIYEALSKKVSADDVEKMVNDSVDSINGQIEFLYKKITVSEENSKKYVDEKYNELAGKLLNVETNVNNAIPMLRNLVYQNAESIKNVDKKLVKYINVKMQSVDRKLKDVEEIKEFAQFNTDTLNGLAAKLGEVEYALRKQIEGVKKDVESVKKDVEGVKVATEENKKALETKAGKDELDAVAKKADSANTLSIVGLILGIVGVGLGVYAAFVKP
ncbi:S-layer protein [Thermosipho melanesiensis]|uniref:S-layer domain protein n=2 Tax=Thermosipho melanesiensis TaxID=46541 RepID=A6LJF2_THEM4|nr:S-layer homology domain-containing protein [Thermosipho melanesiensis]ABR30053.1 S-layer domain protein [Thermosipho melanesiensis BI429]APT73250.1 S-layer protein [Thermosipho melanesiensis]OOC38647.1 S-layer protein [Thermosipho melanesiensis]OOC40451.1 S-layer protein [Thermosipho melanesiensis]OOC40716.1 S-layer protein [Thermosipho melanesiensis]